MSDLTVVALYDDLIRLMNNKRDKRTERSLKAFAQESQLLLERYCELFQECQRLQALVNVKVDECTESERRMNNARLLLDQEKKKTHRVLYQNQRLVSGEKNTCRRQQLPVFLQQEQLDQVKELLCKDKVNEEAKQKLSFLNNYNGSERLPRNLSCINEVNSTGSMLSDFSYSRSDNGLDTSCNNEKNGWSKRTCANGDADPPVKKRKSDHKVVEVSLQEVPRRSRSWRLPIK